MKREVNTPNIVVDDNYRMLVKRLTRRYAERGASVYADADAIEQERCDARARAIAPDAYRISRALGDNPEMYKHHAASGSKHMTTDDYLVYFSKCHDTFDAVNYYNLHAEAVSEKSEDAKPRVLVNKKRMEKITREGAKQEARARVRKPAVSAEKPVASAEDRVRKETTRVAAHETREIRFGPVTRKAFTAFAAAAASIAIVIGAAFTIAPRDEVPTYARSVAEENVSGSMADMEGQEFLQNVE